MSEAAERALSDSIETSEPVRPAEIREQSGTTLMATPPTTAQTTSPSSVDGATCSTTDASTRSLSQREMPASSAMPSGGQADPIPPRDLATHARSAARRSASRRRDQADLSTSGVAETAAAAATTQALTDEGEFYRRTGIRPYYERGGIVLVHSDCRDVLPTLERVDHVITDPPYSEYVHSKSRAGARVLDETGYAADFSRAVDFGFDSLTPELMAYTAREFSRLAARWALVFSDVESSHLWRNALTCGGLDYVRTGAWQKLNGSPQFTGDRPGVGFEAITICHPSGRKRWNGGGLPALWAHAVVKSHIGGDQRQHTTQKPLALMAELVSLFTDPGELILDPFAGSGTTLVAAKQLGRRAIGVELEEKYAEVAAKRLEATTPPFPGFHETEAPVQGRYELA